MGRWQMIQADQKPAKEYMISDNQAKPSNAKKAVKRKQPTQSSTRASKKQKMPTIAPVGLKWDQVNYSCAYDALFIGLYHIWHDHGALWSNRFASITDFTKQLGQGFESYSMKTRSLETVRNQVRKSLANANPNGFPNGPVFTYLDILTDTMFGQRFWGRDTTKCMTCDLVGVDTQGYPCTRTVYKDAALKARYKEEYMLSHWLNTLRISRANGRCTACQNSLARIEIPVTAPPILHFALDDTLMRLDPAFNITVGGTAVRYALRSVIYIGNHHFTSRIVKKNGDIWFHDGIEMGITSIPEGNVHSQGPWFLNTCKRNGDTRTACGAIYAVVDDAHI
jgi:hypothetical protein